MPTFFILIFLLILAYTPHHLSYTPISHRRILHQPFIPLPSSNPPTQPPSSSPQSQPQQQTSPPIPKFPFSSSTPNKQPFFPSYPSPPPPTPSSSASSTNTFPANISSLIFPHTPHHKPISPKLVATAVILALFSISFIASIILLLYYKNRRKFPINKTSRSDSHRLFPANTAPSDGHLKVRSHGGATTGPSSEFLYLGTLVNSRGIDCDGVDSGSVGAASSTSSYVKLGSPELHPLPPLARSSSRQNYRNAGVGSEGEDEEEEFYSPRGSSGRKEESLTGTGSSSRRVSAAVGMENFESRSSNSSDPSSPTSNFNVGAKSFEKRSSNSSDRSSPTSNSALGVKKFESRSSNSSNSSCPTSNSASPTSLSPRSLKSKKFPDSVVKLPPPPPPLPRPMTPSPPKRKPTSPSPPSSPPERDLEKNPHSPSRLSNVSGQNQDSFAKNIGVSRNTISFPPPPTRPPPPPPPLPKFWENPNPFTQVQELTISRPSVLITPSRPVAFNNSSNEVSPAEFSQNLEETPKPKLKPLHWDKVRASSDRAMVWDQLKSSSFQLNEEMIETLFVVNGTSMTPKETTWRPVLPPPNQENRVLDPKKSQNIAILLRALNVTIEEVCEALLEGNSDTLGTELLESLLKMAPTKEEERKLKDYKDDSPFKLGPAERFLKALLDIPFAFKRVDAMLYIANFDSEVEYLKKSFATLEAACEELRNNRMFIKLLEAVLKTGNRMNVGTNRGDAHAFKLDTLLKLVDVKGTDGKTTLLHFVVQEIIRAEGSRISVSNQSNFQNDIEFRKLGLPVVAGLSGDLTNVKKAAAMESDILSNDVSKLARGIGNVGEVLKLNETMGSKESSKRFSDSMNNFLKKAEEDIIKIQAQETVALSLVKEITEYFHGNSTKEEAHPFRIFMVVRDFLSVLDRVCKEVGKINERTTVSSARQFPVPINPTQPPVFPIFHAKPQYSSSEDESSSSS